MSALLSSAFAALLATTVSHGQVMNLQRQLHAGEVDRYGLAITTEISMGGMGQAMPGSKTTGDIVIKIGKLLSGGHSAEAAITTKISGMPGGMGGMFGGQGSSMPKEMSETGVIDSRGRFVAKDYDSPKIKSAMSMFTGSDPQRAVILIELPDRPVKVGGSWEMAMSGMKMLGVENGKIKLTLVGSGQVHGHPIWKIKLSGHFPISMDLKKMMAQMGAMGGQNANADAMKKMSMTMSGTMDFSGTGAVDQHSGKTVSLADGITMHMNMTMDMGGQTNGQPMNMKMDMKMSSDMTLKG